MDSWIKGPPTDDGVYWTVWRPMKLDDTLVQIVEVWMGVIFVPGSHQELQPEYFLWHKPIPAPEIPK